MTRFSRLTQLASLALVLVAVATPVVAGDDEDAGCRVKDPGPDVVIHVPVDEMDVLLRADRRGIVLKHEEYERLLAEARAQAKATRARPPADGGMVSAAGVLDLTRPLGARLELTYGVQVLAERPSTIAFPGRNLAFDAVEVEGEGHYEELDGEGRLRFAGPGSRTVKVVAYATPTVAGDRHLFDLLLPPASAMSLTVKLPAAVEGEVRGEGPGVRFRTPAEAAEEISVRPAADGRLKIVWGAASQSVDGPPVIDVETKTLHDIEDGLIRSKILVHVDVLRAPVRKLTLAVPADLALRAVGGKRVTGTVRSDDRERIEVEFDAPLRGRVALTLDGETPNTPRAAVVLPRVVVLDAVRQSGEVVLAFESDVEVHGVRVEGGRRLPSLRRKGRAPLLRYALSRAEGRVLVDLAPGDVRIEASSTYYLNLTEPAQTLLAALTYRVARGTAFRLEPRFPAGFAVLALKVNGRTDGFRLDNREDGSIEVRLDRGVKEGGEIALTATLEKAVADWVPEQGAIVVPFPIPNAGAAREEAFVGVGADASFRVLDADVKDLVPVGAAELTTRGVSPVGLVYGYRLDGPAPSVGLEVERRTPRLEATVVAHAEPGARRLTVQNAVIHTIERAGVRRLLVDVPAWAGDEVRIHAADLIASSKIDDPPADVPEGYVRWEAVLSGRVLGRHVLVVRYHEDQVQDDWSVPADRPLAVTVPLDQVERSVVVARSPGLEVDLSGDANVQDLAELPRYAKVDPLTVREVVRLDPGMNGPGIFVRKHEGAPVLDAVAPTVVLDTGVARAGILRTRATVRLVNVGLQFLRVALPPSSELVGTTVDAESVKPLVDPLGVLRIPIPPARTQNATTTVAFTYETHLAHAAKGNVAVPSPEFPDLEVLKTTHTVAFDPSFEIHAVNGDYGRTGGRRRPESQPWILGSLFAAGSKFAPAAGMLGADAEAPTAEQSMAQGEYVQDFETEAPSSGEEPGGGWLAWTEDSDPGAEVPAAEVPAAVRREIALAQAREGQLAADRSLVELQQEAHRLAQTQQELTQAGDLFRSDRAQAELAALRLNLDELQQAGEPAPTTLLAPMQVIAPEVTVYETVETAEGRKVVVVKPGSTRLEGFSTPRTTLMPSPRAATDPNAPPPPAVTQPQTDAPAQRGHAGPPPAGGPVPQPGMPPRPQGAAPAAGGEGPVPAAPRVPTRTKRRKGLLSLDVPVLLSWNEVKAERLGSGGTMVVSIVRKESETARHALLGIAFFTVGLALATRKRRLAWLLPVVGGIGLAVLVALFFGVDGATVTVALVDAVTALLIVLVLRWLVRRIFLGSGVRKAATAALLGLAFVVPVATAQADEEDLVDRKAAEGRSVAAADDAPTEVEAPRPVYVPYDPDDPAVPRPDDRVFLPFDTYLHLRKVAYPDRDPEILEKGRLTALIGAKHQLGIGSEEAKGAMVLSFAKRGEGPHRVSLPLGGLAVTRAVLDGAPVRLLLEDGAYTVRLDKPGTHVLELSYRAPVARSAVGRSVVLDVPSFAAAVLDLSVDDFEGEVRVAGAGRVAPVLQVSQQARTRVHLGALSRVTIECLDPVGTEPEVALRTRAESRVVHSIRDGGTESRFEVTLHVLQGEARHVDLALPEGLTVLRAAGPEVARWEEAPGRLRLVFAKPIQGSASMGIVVRRAATTPARQEELPALAVLDTTGERGTVVVNAHPFLRVEPEIAEGLLRTGTPRNQGARGADGVGRVAGAWHFSARPTRFVAAIEEASEGLMLETTAVAAFGDDHLRCRFDAVLSVDPRVPVGDLVFELPGTDEIRNVTSSGLATWWAEGEGEARTLHLRYTELREGTVGISLALERRLGGRRDGVSVPRWLLRGARRDRGVLVLYARPDLEPDPGRLPRLRSIPLTEAPRPTSPIEGALPVRAFRWEEPADSSLPVTLRTPALEVEAVVVTEVQPGDEMHRIDHLVLFDVRRGATERFDVFVPDGGYATLDVVRTRDLREVRRSSVKRRGPDGNEVDGTLYEIRTQSARGGIVVVTVGQLHLPDLAVRSVRPERIRAEDGSDREVKAVRYFGLVRGFLDGDVQVNATAGEPGPAAWDDLPFLPSGLEQADVFKAYAARAPYVLDIRARRHVLESQSGAVVHAAQADVVLGRDGQARVRVSYRLFNRRRQFLRVTLPPRSVLFGVTVAGRPVKTLQGVGGSLLVPVPKVPLGGAGYAVALLYRSPAGSALPARDLQIDLPKLEGAKVDRTVVRLFVPDGFDYDIESEMTETEAEELAADLAEAAVREAKGLISIAKSGNLEQRTLAADNAAQIIAEANELNKRSGNKRKGLDRDVQQVTREFQDRYRSVEKDLRAANRARAGQEELEIYGSNAARFVSMGEDQARLVPSEGAQAGARVETSNPKWKFNPYRDEEKADKKQEFQQLKERLGKALEERSKQEVADYEVEIAQASNISGLVLQDGTRVEPDATWRNFARLNDALAASQDRNRQLDVTSQQQQAGQFFFGSAANPNGIDFRGLGGDTAGALVNLDDVTNGLQGGQADFIPPTIQLVSPDMVSDEEQPLFGAEGDYRGRTENTFARGFMLFAGDGDVGSGTTTTASWGQGGYQGGTGRTGLMGVDVELPKGGTVYRFRALHAGAPLEISASREGWNPLVRWLVFLGILAAAVVGLGLLSARARMRARTGQAIG